MILPPSVTDTLTAAGWAPAAVDWWTFKATRDGRTASGEIVVYDATINLTLWADTPDGPRTWSSRYSPDSPSRWLTLAVDEGRLLAEELAGHHDDEPF